MKCHCGCVKLMEWEGGGVRVGRKRRKQGEDTGDQESQDDLVNDDNCKRQSNVCVILHCHLLYLLITCSQSRYSLPLVWPALSTW